MPLSPPAQREHMYTRTIECRSYLRADGLWDVEGHLRDVRSFPSYMQYRGEVAAGTPVHEMSLRVSFDEDMMIRAVEAVMDGTPYGICSGVTVNYQRLVGVRLGAGFAKAIRDRLGGPEGCTHLREMLGPMATAAFQAVFNYRHPRGAGDQPGARERLLDSCHALASNREVVLGRWPDAYTGTR